MNDLKVVEEFLNTLDKLVIKVSNCLELDENDQQMIATMKLLQGNPKRYTLETISALMSWNAQLVNDLKEYQRAYTERQMAEWEERIQAKLLEFALVTERTYISDSLVERYQEVVDIMTNEGYSFSRKLTFKNTLTNESDVRHNVQLISYYINTVKAEQFKKQLAQIKDVLERTVETNKIMIA